MNILSEKIKDVVRSTRERRGKVVDCLRRSGSNLTYMIEHENGSRQEVSRQAVIDIFPNEALDYYENLIEKDLTKKNPRTAIQIE